jgi:hypothetical protein
VLFELRRKIIAIRPSLEERIAGHRGLFGGGQTTHLDEPAVRQRFSQWLQMRELQGEPVAIKIR